MVLGKEELQAESSEPGEEAGVAASNPARDIPEQNETDNLENKSDKNISASVLLTRLFQI